MDLRGDHSTTPRSYLGPRCPREGQAASPSPTEGVKETLTGSSPRNSVRSSARERKGEKRKGEEEGGVEEEGGEEEERREEEE